MLVYCASPCRWIGRIFFFLFFSFRFVRKSWVDFYVLSVMRIFLLLNSYIVLFIHFLFFRSLSLAVIHSFIYLGHIFYESAIIPICYRPSTAIVKPSIHTILHDVCCVLCRICLFILVIYTQICMCRQINTWTRSVLKKFKENLSRIDEQTTRHKQRSQKSSRPLNIPVIIWNEIFHREWKILVVKHIF